MSHLISMTTVGTPAFESDSIIFWMVFVFPVHVAPAMSPCRFIVAKDRDAIKKASDNFPITSYYNIEDELLALGIGEAFVTVLSEK